MKKLLIISAIVGIVALNTNQAEAQVNLNINIGSQPAWIPNGYQSVNYYYLPEVQSYYSVPTRQFVYLKENRWIRSRELPNRYRGYNLNHGRKIVVYGNNPYRSYKTHRVRYANQVNIVAPSYRSRQVVRNGFPERGYRSIKVKTNRHDRYENHGHKERGREKRRH